MKEDFHIDLSNRFYSKKTTGIAFVGTKSKSNKGCVLSNRLKKDIKKYLFRESYYKEYAKLYAICIYYIMKEDFNKINKLIICHDEIFYYVRQYLFKLFKEDKKEINFEIISIREYRLSLGRKVSSLADNLARIYAKKGLKPTRWHRGKKIDVVNITLDMIRKKWSL